MCIISFARPSHLRSCFQIVSCKLKSTNAHMRIILTDEGLARPLCDNSHCMESTLHHISQSGVPFHFREFSGRMIRANAMVIFLLCLDSGLANLTGDSLEGVSSNSPPVSPNQKERRSKCLLKSHLQFSILTRT